MSNKRSKRLEPEHKFKEYLDSKTESNIDLFASTGIGKSTISKLKGFDIILSAERLYIISKVYSDDLKSTINSIFPDLELPSKPKKDFADERSILENILLPLPKGHMSLEEMSYLTDIDIDRLKEILSKSTVVISASELILLEKVKKLKAGTLFKAIFSGIKIKRVKKI